MNGKRTNETVVINVTWEQKQEITGSIVKIMWNFNNIN